MKILIILFFSFSISLGQVNTTTSDDNITQNEEYQLQKQRELVDEVIENINDETFLDILQTKSLTKEKLELLRNKIVINEEADNTLAVKRDELEVMAIREKILYEDTLKEIIKAKREFRKIGFYDTLLAKNIEKIKSNPLDEYRKIYKEHKEYNSSLSIAFSENFENLTKQRTEQLFVLNYLKTNISEFRKINFFIDEFNLQSIIKKIDSIENISYLSNLTSYHLGFSIGELVVVVFIFLIIRFISIKVIYYIAAFIANIFIQSKNSTDDADTIREYLKNAINTPLVLALYLLSFQIAVYIFIKDPALIANIKPWINTGYMALFTWGLYEILNNGTSNYAESFFEKYPNVRKEIIVFMLRITKVVLAFLVILFLLTQLGMDIKAIVASLGIGGIAIALAAKDTLVNFFGSLSILADNSFSQGDWIKTGEIEGIVVDIKMRTTRIRTFDNGMITVPNSHLANTNITNWSKRVIGRRIYMNVAITYETKMENIVKLKNAIYEMLEDHPQIATQRNSQVARGLGFEVIERESLQGIMRTLFVYIDEYSSSSINIMIYCFSKSTEWEEWLKTKEDVIIKISQLVKENDCQFAYPTQTLWMKNKESELGEDKALNLSQSYNI